MSRERRRRAVRHLLALLDVEPERRPDVLGELCGDDGELRREVESLLALEDDAEGFLPEPAVRREGPDLEPGSRLGPYRVVELLERGGMGAVYRAEREDDFEKRVAVKVLRRDALRDETIRRFHVERQVLARLDHPGVARLLDGGTTPGGRPYLVMEQVDGTSITRHCAAGALTVRQRLVLFREVLAAVAYAHRNLVVHRDLKPENVLINTSSDVYSLGVLLFELLTGHLPCVFDGCAFKEVYPRACGDRAPQTTGDDGARKKLGRDLEAIVTKALCKEPEERYGSVEQLAEDLRRHLAGLPVRARASTWSYRARRFVGRHRWGAAVVVLLLVLTAASTTLRWQAERERAAAVRAERRAVRVTAFLKDLFESADPDAARGRVLTAHEVLDFGRTQLVENLGKDPEADAALAETLAHAYGNLGFHEEAERLLELARSVRREKPGVR